MLIIDVVYAQAMPEKPSLARLDLNLLVPLDALLTERSVTRAAERLRLSQPALSAALARLRTHFNDPILARRGNVYELTPLAQRLAEYTSTALETARRVFESQSEWQADRSTREFTLYGSDYAFSTVGAVVSRLAAERAPGVRFRFMLHTPPIVEDAANRLRSVDGLLIPHGFLSDLLYDDLWSDRWVIVASATNARARAGLTMADLAVAHWVFTYQSLTSFTSATRQLQQLGVETLVDAVVESFLALPWYLVGTDRLGLVQEALAPSATASGDVIVVEPPFDVTPLLNALWWHPSHRNDPEHAWMRALFREAGEVLAAEHASP
jgi:DNA-binding transcriptional LysR family regulator